MYFYWHIPLASFINTYLIFSKAQQLPLVMESSADDAGDEGLMSLWMFASTWRTCRSTSPQVFNGMPILERYFSIHFQRMAELKQLSITGIWPTHKVQFDWTARTKPRGATAPACEGSTVEVQRGLSSVSPNIDAPHWWDYHELIGHFLLLVTEGSLQKLQRNLVHFTSDEIVFFVHINTCFQLLN